MTSEATDRSLKQELRYQLEIFALCGFAIAQPILDTFGNHLEAFVFRGAGRVEVVVFALAVTLGPWLAVGIVAAATRLAGVAVRRWVQVAVLASLATLITLHVVKQTSSLRGVPLAVAAGAVGGAFGYAYARFRQISLWARYACVAPVMFLALFLVASPTSSLVFPDSADAADVASSKLPRHIVFLLFDELPTESLIDKDARIDADRFPNFAQLASSSTWYRNYTSVSGSTEFAVPAVLSGSYPKDEDATAANYPHNLFTLLGGGYDVHASEVVTALCPQSVCTKRSKGVSALSNLSDDALDVWRQQISLESSRRQLEAGFVEETQTDEQIAGSSEPDRDLFKVLSEQATNGPSRLTDFINGIETDKPTLELIHLLLPHQPWHFYPSGLQYPHPDKDPGLHVFLTGRWGSEVRPAELGRQRHLLQTQYVDHLLGQVVANLKQRGIYDDSLLVVTADHGAAFTPDEELRPGIYSDGFPTKIYEQIMWAPLLIKAPHQRTGVVSDVNMQSIDLLPTIADMVGVELPWKVDGVPVSTPRRNAKKSFVTSRTIAFESLTLGKRFTVDGQTGFRRMLAGSSRRFAPQTGSDPRWSFYKVGTYARFIGRAADALPTGPASSFTVKLDDAGAYSSVDLKSGSLPGLLLGTAPGGATIAVSVNGTLAGVSPTFTDDSGTLRFGVVIPDFLFRDGKNDIRLFSVQGSGAAAVFHPIAGP